MCSCAVRSQVLQKSKTVCASLHVAKAPKLFSLSSKGRDPGFLLKMFFPWPSQSHYVCWLWWIRKGEGQSLRILEQFALWSIWRRSGLITGETEQNREADGREQKAILVWGEISRFSSTSRCYYWTDRWILPQLEKGRVYHWGRRTVHTLSVENLRSWVKKRRNRLVDFPAGLNLHLEKSRRKRKHTKTFHFISAWSLSQSIARQGRLLLLMMFGTDYKPVLCPKALLLSSNLSGGVLRMSPQHEM